MRVFHEVTSLLGILPNSSTASLRLPSFAYPFIIMLWVMTLGSVIDLAAQQASGVGEGSAGEVGVEERVLEEDGGREAHADEAGVQCARAGERAAGSTRAQRVRERLRDDHVGGGAGSGKRRRRRRWRPWRRHHSNTGRSGGEVDVKRSMTSGAEMCEPCLGVDQKVLAQIPFSKCESVKCSLPCLLTAFCSSAPSSLVCVSLTLSLLARRVPARSHARRGRAALGYSVGGEAMEEGGDGSLEARPGVLLVGAPGVGKRTILSREIPPPLALLPLTSVHVLIAVRV